MTAATLVERVARALRFTMYGVPDSRPLDESSPWLIYARVAIEEIRDNPPKGFEKIVYHGDYGDDVWRDSIDAALKGEG